MRLVDVARVVRSKNAGPLTVTVDLMFPELHAYETAAASPQLTARAVARLYGVPADTVKVIAFPPALAIKIVMDRPIVAGSPGDRDVYGAQQHKPLLELEL